MLDQPPPPQPALVFRPASPEDTPAVMEITRYIWEGEDYIPQVWEHWLQDPEGLLVVAELDGRVVGLGKLSRLLPGSWWLEGLRVHPEFQGRGIASRLFAHLHTHWLQHGGGVIRLATYSENFTVHRMCNRMEYKKIIAFTPFEAPVISGNAPSSFSPLPETQARDVLEIARESESMRRCCGLVDLDWTWVDINAQTLVSAAAQGSLWTWNDGLGFLATRIRVDKNSPGNLYPQMIACPLSSLEEMLVDFRRQAGALGYTIAGWNAPLHPEELSILAQAGFSRDWEDGSLYLYEFRHNPVSP
jgi:GNAT superfamily N-acetyltransferase